MADDTFKPLLMGYLDEELTELEALRMEEHLKECQDCAAELREFRRLKEVTHNMRVVTPDDKYWEQYWSNIYNRLERRIGWILISIGAILLTSYGLYYLVSSLLLQGNIPIIVRIGVVALVVGFCTLIISGLRERIFLAKSDKYERIKR
jgi:predicted anti-sigma-YlaC factor YlaD